MKNLKEETGKASRIIEKYKNEVCDICDGGDYICGRIDHYVKLMSDIINA